MKKRLLSFCLIIMICISNVAGVYASEPESVDVSEEISDEINDEEPSSSTQADTFEETETETITEISSESESEVSEVTSEETETTDSEPSGSEPVVLPENLFEEISLESLDRNYIVDKTAPYSGEYLIITNSNKLYTNTTENVGASSDIIELPEDGIVPDDFEGLPVPTFEEPDELSLAEAGQLGARREFYLNGSKSGTQCECVSVSEHSVVWVPVSDPLFQSNPTKMKSQMAQISAEFDAKYNKLTSSFGSLDYADKFGDNDGRVALICYDIDGDAATKSTGFTSGRFSGKDMNVAFSNATGNNIDCIHLDSWQGMQRSSDGKTIGNVSYIYETLMHETEHMIMWSNLRRVEEKRGSITFEMKVPAYIDEGFAEAAVHLCYGKSTGRIERFNNGGAKGGRLSVLNWTQNVDNYALDYLFFQYIRAQYAQKTETDGWDIYKTAVSKVTNTSDDGSTAQGAAVLDSIASELDVTSEELIENFWIAVFLLNGSGPYGFGGEAWAEAIQPQITTTKATSLKPGTSQVIAINSDYTPISHGSNIVFAGLSKKNSVSSKEEITISGNTTLSTIGAKTTLTATSTKTNPAEITWSIPNARDKEIISVDSKGNVTALSKYGTAIVRATSSTYTDVYADIEITVLHDTAKDIKFSKRTVNSAYGEKTFYCPTSRPAGGKVYYTLQNRDATVNDNLLPDEGIKIEGPGSVKVNVLAVAEGFYDTTLTETISFTSLQEPKIKTTVLTDGSCSIEFDNPNESSAVFYTLDGSSPIDNGTRYANKAFKASIDTIVKIRAVVRRLGYVDSDVVEYSFDSYPRVSFSDIDIIPEYGGFRFMVTAKDKNVVLRYTINGSKPTSADRIFPTKGLKLDVGQDVCLTVTGWKEGCIPVTKSCELHIDKLDKPQVSTKYVGYLNAYEVTIEDQSHNDNVLIYYRLDSSANDVEYNGPFYIDAEVNHVMNAYSLGYGIARSDAQKVTVEKVIPPYRRLTAIPRLTVANVMLNKQQEGKVCAPVTLMPMEAEEILSCQLDGKNAEAFEIKHISEDDWEIVLKDMTLKPGSYKFSLLMRGTEYEEEPAQKATIVVKVLDKKPVVTLKKVTAFKNYTDVVIPLTVTSKDGAVEIVALKNKTDGFTDNFRLIDADSDGHYDSITMARPYDELVKDAKNKQVMLGLLTVRVDGYVEQDIALNIGLNSTIAKLAQVVANPKYEYNAFAADGYKATLPLTIVNFQNKKVPFAITSAENIKVDTNAKTYEKVAPLLDAAKPADIDENGSVVIRLAKPDAELTGTFSVPLLISGKSDVGEFKNVAITAKFTIDKPISQIKATLKPANLSLNKQTDDHAYSQITLSHPNVRIKSVECTPLAAAGKANLDERVKVRYNASKDSMEAYFDGYTGADSITCSTYKFECIPTYESMVTHTVIESTQVIKITVTVTNKAATINATPKGSINVLNRDESYIRYTIKKNGFGADFEYSDMALPTVKIAEPLSIGKNEVDATDMFELTGDTDSLEKSQTVDIRLKNDAEIIRGQRYVLRLAILLENGEYAYTPNLKITPTQPNVVLKQATVPIVYKNVNMRKRVATIPIDTGIYEIEKITLNELKNGSRPAGLKVALAEDGKSIIVTLSDSSVKPSKYMTHLNIIYKGEMIEKDGKPKTYPASYGVFVK